MLRSWPYAADDRLCGGAYNCEASGGYCGGLEEAPKCQNSPAGPELGSNWVKVGDSFGL